MTNVTAHTPSRAPAALPERLAATAVFLASAAVLVLEIVGLRLVGPYIGVTLQTSSAVIGIALAAIAYGAWTGGWLADRMDPRRLLTPAFILSAIATAVTLPLVRWAGELLRGSAAGGVLLLTAVTVFVPAALLSAITPLVVKLQLRDMRRTGRVVGRLSSIGTLGAVTATLSTGFVLVAALPTSTILISLAIVLGAMGVVLYTYLRRIDAAAVALVRRDRIITGLAVVGLTGTGLTAMIPNPCDVETAYHCARIEIDPDRDTGRLLLLNSARHSYVDLADPTYLEFAYTQWIGGFLDVAKPAREPMRVLHLGGGGFTLPDISTRPDRAHSAGYSNWTADWSSSTRPNWAYGGDHSWRSASATPGLSSRPSRPPTTTSLSATPSAISSSLGISPPGNSCPTCVAYSPRGAPMR